ncbi:hypothetical protein RQP46_000705 [Phenoliferia psychrophenolica]
MPGVRVRGLVLVAVLAALSLLLSLANRGAPLLSAEKVTVIISSHQTTGRRSAWLLKSLQKYTSLELESIVDQVILVWNGVGLERDVPDVPSGVTVVRGFGSSVNNRWVHTIPHIRTEAVLNLDDDVSISRAAIASMYRYWSAEPERLVGPFVRATQGATYSSDELTKMPGSTHSLVLPRVLMLSRAYLVQYASPGYTELRRIVDSDEAHCDDLLLNLVAAHTSPRPPLRIVLPERSVSDYGSTCAYTPPPERNGPGEELQLYCPETDSTVTEWIDQLERNPICGESRAGSTEKDALVESAKHQVF